jgi:3,4-dihydroxy-2-butanone 4-phosphate synthase
MESEETLRWPTNLDRAAIEKRLIQARSTAEQQGWTEVAALLAGIESKKPPEIAKAVMASLEWLQRQPEMRAFALQLQMVALNLKNLKE